MNTAFQPGEWALLAIHNISNAKVEIKRTRLDIEFESVKFPGNCFWDSFYLSEKAISRLECLAHRAGVERAVKAADDVSLAFIAELKGKRVWALLTTDEKFARGAVITDGWNFRPESEPPETQAAIDYQKLDEEAIAMEGL
jgi:hypothetical protein